MRHCPVHFQKTLKMDTTITKPVPMPSYLFFNPLSLHAVKISLATTCDNCLLSSSVHLLGKLGSIFSVVSQTLLLFPLLLTCSIVLTIPCSALLQYVLEGPKLYTVLQIWPCECQREGSFLSLTCLAVPFSHFQHRRSRPYTGWK